MVSFIVLILFGFLGLISHWFKRWARKQTEENFISYMVCNRKSSIASITTVIASIVGMLTVAGGGVIELSTQAVSTAFLAGYAVDSAVNK